MTNNNSLARTVLRVVFLLTYTAVCSSRKYCRNNVCLVGGSADHEGNVEIGGKGVCDDSWGMEDAAVICRQIGFAGVVKFTRESEFGNARRIGYDDVGCVGEESRIADCQFTKQHDCSSSEAAGVVCATEVVDIVPSSCRQVGAVCLIGGQDKFSGNVYFEGRPVCDAGWDFADAYVTCRHLGFGKAINVTKGGVFGNCLDYFSMYTVGCEGNENKLQDCKHETDSGTCKHVQVAGVACAPPKGTLFSDHSSVWFAVGIVCLMIGLISAAIIWTKVKQRGSNILLETSSDTSSINN